MCTYSIWEAGITHIVYGVTYETFAKLITKDVPFISCEKIYRLLKTPAVITGGILEEEGVRVYNHWPKQRVSPRTGHHI